MAAVELGRNHGATPVMETGPEDDTPRPSPLGRSSFPYLTTGPLTWSTSTEEWRPTVSLLFKEIDVELMLWLIESLSGGLHTYRNGSKWGLFAFDDLDWPIMAHQANQLGYKNDRDITSPADQLVVAAFLIYSTVEGFGHFIREENIK